MKAAGTSIWQPTVDTYLPNRSSFPVDGSKYGSSPATLEAVRNCEELAIALTRLAQTISAADWDICDKKGKPLPHGKDHPAAKLFLQPNPLCDWSDFVQTCVFMWPTGSINLLMDMSMAKSPMRLWLLRSDRTRPIRSSDPVKVLDGFEHYGEDGHRYVFPVEQIIHLKQPNPFTPYQGLGVSELIDMTLNMDMATLNYNWRFFLQGAKLATVLESDKKIGVEERNQLMQQFRQRYEGWQNAHRLMILDDGLKQSTAGDKTPIETGFMETRKSISRTVGGIMGVPPIHMGHVEDANRANSASQQALFYTNGVSPIARRLNDAFTRVVQRFDESLTFRFRLASTIDEETAGQLITAATGSGAMSPNDIRVKYLGQEPVLDPAMDKHYIPMNMVAIEDLKDAVIPTEPKPGAPGAGAPKPKPAAGEKPGDSPKLPAVKDSIAEHQAVERAWIALAADGKAPKGTPVQRRVLRFLVGQRKAPSKLLARAYGRWLMAIANHAASQLEGSQSSADKAMQNGWNAVRLAVDDESPRLKASVDPIYQDQLTAQYAAMVDLFDVDAPAFEPGDSRFASATRRLAQRVTGVEQRVKEELNSIIREGAERGLTPYEIANGTADGEFAGIRGEFSDMAQERAQLIARTETGALQDQASVAAYRVMGVSILDVIGCEDFEKMPGEVYGCNSQGIPIDQADDIEFHPNHLGAIVPRIEKALHLARLLRPMEAVKA